MLFAALTALVLRKTETMQRKVQDHHSDLAERASDALGNIALVQSFARVESEVTALQDASERLLAAQFPVLSWWAVVAVLTRAATTLTVLSIILLGTWLFQHGLITIGEIVTFMAFVRHGDRAARAGGQFRQPHGDGRGHVARIFRRVSIPIPTIHDRPDAVDPGRMTGRVEFNDVSFSYDGKRPAVAGSELHARCRARPWRWWARPAPASRPRWPCCIAPSIRNPATSRSTAWISRISSLPHFAAISAWCFRRSLLFNRSIAENMRIGKPDADADQMRAAAAARRRSISSNTIPNGFDAKVGERGRALSGGERQRLSIARALLKDPPILILDEATSALDAATESKVLVALDEVMKNRTTFVIAHRLATIRKATRILVFEGGRIVESGSFDELSRLGGRFTQAHQGAVHGRSTH